MQELNTKTIRDIALEFPQTTRIFEEFKIDYCCGGRKPLGEACETAGLDTEVIRKKIETAIEGTKENVTDDFPENKNTTDLTNYIIDTHHVFTDAEIARLTPLMQKVSSKHGLQHPELFEIQKAFYALCEELTPHMRKEEMVLFPYIKVLAAVVSTNLPIATPHFQTVQNPVRMMMSEHDSAGDLLRQMREDSDNYSLPPEACPSFKALYFGLEELEKDLHRHIHLENNVLFPQAIELEVRVLGDIAAAANEEHACGTACG